MARRSPPVWVLFALVLVLNLFLANSRSPPFASEQHPSPSARAPAAATGRWPSFGTPSFRQHSPFRSLKRPRQPTQAHAALGRRTEPSTAEEELLLLTFPFPDPPPPESPPASPWVLLPSLLLYTLALLGSLGIVSGDYLVPNLSSLAAQLGMSDNTAGVTLLAFGNGSPDVFATYAAFTSDSGSLAIGELLGAALFIVTVVVGCMALIQPFAVHRGPFLRDVGFALAAVALLLLVMRDGELQTWEAGCMVGLYVTYVAGVVGGGYVIRWRERREGQIRLGTDEDEGLLFDQEEEFHDEDQPQLGAEDGFASSALPSPPVQRPISLGPVPPVTDLLVPPTDGRRPALRVSTSQPSIASSAGSSSSRSPTPRRPGAHPHARSRRSSNASQQSFDVRRSTFSLLGAVEFRDLVNSLRDEDDVSRQALRDGFVGGKSPFGGGHYHAHAQPHHHGHGHSRSRSTSAAAAAAGGSVSAGQAVRSPSRSPARSRDGSVPGGGGSKSVPAALTASIAAVATSISGRDVLANEVNPWDDASAVLSSSAQSGATIRPGHYSPGVPTASPAAHPSRAPAGSTLAPPTPSPAPAIILQPSSTSSSQAILLAASHPDGTGAGGKPSKRRRALHIARLTYHTLFPSLQQFGRKSLVGRVLSVVAVPVILALTLTVVVVDDRGEGADSDSTSSVLDGDDGDGDDDKEQSHAALAAEVTHGRLLDLGENPTRSPSRSPDPHQLQHPHHTHPHEHANGHAHAHAHDGPGGQKAVAEELGPRLEVLRDGLVDGGAVANVDEGETEEEMCFEEECADVALGFNKWLLAAQCIFGPTVSVLIILPPEDPDFSWVPLAAVVGAGFALALCVALFVSTGRHRALRLARCLAGFAVAVVWIMALADEVVSVLTVMAELLGLSDAIVGLTVFAIGNSTADLVADLSIATFSPIMAFSACFGGPMLNILLGIGLSGAYVTLASGKAYPVHISASLVTSVVGLLAILAVTFVFVPYNNYRISKRWGAFLIGFYAAAMTVNVLAEIFWT